MLDDSDNEDSAGLDQEDEVNQKLKLFKDLEDIKKRKQNID